MANARDSARSFGKCDPIDALAVARAALREPDLPVARLDGAEREVRLLVDHREDLVGERTRMISRLRWHLHELDPGNEPAPRTLNHPRNLDRLAERLAGVEGTVARIARDLVERCRAAHDRDQPSSSTRSARSSQQLAPSLLAICGCGRAHRRQDPRRDRRHRTLQEPRRLRPPQRHRTAAGLVVEPSSATDSAAPATGN